MGIRLRVLRQMLAQRRRVESPILVYTTSEDEGEKRDDNKASSSRLVINIPGSDEEGDKDSLDEEEEAYASLDSDSHAEPVPEKGEGKGVPLSSQEKTNGSRPLVSQNDKRSYWLSKGIVTPADSP